MLVGFVVSLIYVCIYKGSIGVLLHARYLLSSLYELIHLFFTTQWERHYYFPGLDRGRQRLREVKWGIQDHSVCEVHFGFKPSADSKASFPNQSSIMQCKLY